MVRGSQDQMSRLPTPSKASEPGLKTICLGLTPGWSEVTDPWAPATLVKTPSGETSSTYDGVATKTAPLADTAMLATLQRSEL
jgi:hypothetical protein